jgi:hypothetical protein
VADAPEIKVRLTAEDTGVAAAIRQLGLELKNLKASEQQAAEGAFTLGKAFEALAIVEVARKIEELGREAFDSAINIGKMADKTGLSTETLSVFHKVAEDMAVSTEAVDKGIGKAAKTITEFEAGSAKAAKGFQILHLSTKDFAGLNADQKIALVTDRLGKLAPGFDKATAAQLIFSKGGAEMIPVMDSLASQGFEKVREDTEKLGILFNRDFTDSARAAKASMQDLKDTAVGVAVQFESGFLPSIADIADALDEMSTKGTKGENTLADLGKVAAGSLKVVLIIANGIGSAFELVGSVVELVGGLVLSTFEAIGRAAFAAADVISGNFSKAGTEIKAAVSSYKKDFTDFGSTVAGIAKDNYKFAGALFPSEEEERKRQEERLKRLRVPADQETAPGHIANDAGVQAELRRQQEMDRIAKAAAAALERQLRDELLIWKAYEKEREQTEKTSYEEGKLSTDEYFRRRQADLQNETAKEVAILRAQLKVAQDEAARYGAEKSSNEAKATQLGPETKGGEAYTAAASRNESERIAAVARIQDLETRITTTQIDGQTKALALANERHRAADADHQAVLAFERELAELQGKRIEAARAEIEIEVQKRTEELQRAGVPAAEIDAEISKYRQLKTAVAEYQAMEAQTQQDVKGFELAKQGFEIDQKSGLLTRAQGEQKINDLIKQRLPILLQEAQAQLAAAQKTGNQVEIEKAQNVVLQLQNIGTASAHLKQEINQSLGTGLETVFSTLTRGTKNLAQAFGQMELQIVGSLEKTAAQMIANALTGEAIDKKTQLSAAKTAAGNTWKWVSDIPYVGWILAPIAAAAAFAGVLAFEQGGLVPGTEGQAVPIMAHAKEMVLPAEISTGLQHAIATGEGGGLRSGGGDNYFHDEYHLHHTGPDARSVLERELVPMIQNARRRGSL